MRQRIEQVAAFLQSKGIDGEIALNPPATSEDVAAAERQLGQPLPDSYRQVVTELADGLSIQWQAGDDAGLAQFEMTPVAASVEGLLGMRDWRFYDETEAQEYGFPYTDDPALALETNRQMHHWLPIHGEPNGDFIVVDLNPAGRGRVLLDQHDWLDGGTGANGFLMADSLPEFFDAWATVCYALPKSLDWSSVLTDQGVDWNSPQFDDALRLP